MYGYFDESIITVDGIKYLFLGFIVFNRKQNENMILREFSKTKSKLKNKPEIKYSNVRDFNIKEQVLKKIKSASTYFDTVSFEINSRENIHSLTSRLVTNILSKYLTTTNHKIEIIYDKVSYRIDLQAIYKEFPNIKKFSFRNSDREIGIQYADWIAGEASENFKDTQSKQKNRH
jgi:hypothetical protein